MTFDDWTAEAHRSLEAWQPDLVVALDGRATSPAGAVTESDYAAPTPADGRRPVATRRRLLAAVAAVAIVAGSAVAMVRSSDADADTDVAAGQATGTTPRPVDSTSPSEPTGPTTTSATEATGSTTTTTTPSVPDAAPPGAVRFECSAADREAGAPTDVFDDSPDVAAWRPIDFGPGGPPPGPADGSVADVAGTLVTLDGEAVAASVDRGQAFVASVSPGWSCTVRGPEVDVTAPGQPGPIVDDMGVVTNRLGGMCFVPDATADPSSVWGVDPSLAAALDRIDGLTEWSVILVDRGDDQGPGRLWLEFSFAADPGNLTTDPVLADSDVTNRVLAEVSTAAATAGAAAGVATSCGLH